MVYITCILRVYYEYLSIYSFFVSGTIIGISGLQKNGLCD